MCVLCVLCCCAAKQKKQGVRIADDTAADSGRSKAADAATGLTPSPAAEARLVAECRRNNSWRAILALETVQYRKGEYRCRCQRNVSARGEGWDFCIFFIGTDCVNATAV